MRQLLSLILLALISINCTAQSLKTETFSVQVPSVESPERLPLVEDRPIKNIIFIIGDGTGLAQLHTGQLHLVGKDGMLHIQTMPVTGLVKTHSADKLITDSASGATAFSCGLKTNNGMIGQLPDGRACKTLLELAQEQGKSTGLIATSTITHATPASFAAHIESRQMQAEIAEQFVDAGVDILLGGGLEYFIPESEEGSSRKDDKNLITEFENKGYEFVSTASELLNAESGQVLGLFSESGMPSENRTPTLSEMSATAIEKLSMNDEGFFLMIEGSQIDWAGHGNNVEYALRELQDFDAAVKTVLDFAVEHGETLVVLTADHETGGLTMQSSANDNEMQIAWTTDYHTGIPVPLMAFGPHAMKFSGWWDNTEIGIKVAKLAGYGVFPFIEE